RLLGRVRLGGALRASLARAQHLTIDEHVRQEPGFVLRTGLFGAELGLWQAQLLCPLDQDALRMRHASSNLLSRDGRRAASRPKLGFAAYGNCRAPRDDQASGLVRRFGGMAGATCPAAAPVRVSPGSSGTGTVGCMTRILLCDDH